MAPSEESQNIPARPTRVNQAGRIDSTDVHLSDKGHYPEFLGIREGAPETLIWGELPHR